MSHKRNLVRAAALIALAAAPSAFGQELIEKVVVRNRLYQTGGRIEIGANLGLTLLARLTDHINGHAHVAYNVSDTIGFELRAGYAYSRHTGLANQIADDFAANTSIRTANDLTDLWEMNGSGVAGIRWAPVYGKISLMAELPVHFQAYLWLGGGAAMFKRESIVYCISGSSGNCNEYLTETKVGPMVSAAVGARFFVTPRQSIKMEIRDYSYPDSYRENIDRAVALRGGETGSPATAPGITNLVMFDIGYSFIF